MQAARKPLVSVLLPAFNAENTIAASLRSLQRQTLVEWEGIIVDDGSSDATTRIVTEHAQGDARFSLVTRPHRGLVAALNAGLPLCTGGYIARMDADDLMHRQRLQLQVGHLNQQPQLAAVGCHVRIFPRAHLQAGWRAYESWLRTIRSSADVAREIFVESPLVHPTLMLRREILQAYGYRDRGWPEDYDLLLRLIAGGHAVGVVPQRLLSWRDSPARLSRTHPSYRTEIFATCKAEFLASGFLAHSERYVLWGYGATGRALHAALAQHGKHLAQLVEMHPGRIGNTIHGAPVIKPQDLATPATIPLIVSVAHIRPRQQIRAFLSARGYQERCDFVCAA